MIFASGIGDIELGFTFLRRKQKKARAKTSAQLNFEACMEFKREQLGYTQRDAFDSCSGQLQGCSCFGAARPTRILSPYQIMTTGRMPYFNPGNPYVTIVPSHILDLISRAVRG